MTPRARPAVPPMLQELEQLEACGLAELQRAGDPAALEQWRIKYLGTKGHLKTLMPRMQDVGAADRPAVGRRLNEVKSALEAAFADRKVKLPAAAAIPRVDVTEPGLSVGEGRRHIISRTIDEISDVFARMGFTAAYGPEVEDEWHNFDALNIPKDHPARDATDNFYMPGGLMLRTQTSTVQIRTMAHTQPPLKVIAVGRVYRPDTHDATHYSMFHQVEGLYVDHGVSMVDLKTTLFQFARAYLGPQAEVRMRPSFFPFTEPSAEVDMKMKVKGEYQWVEMGGCGMVDPNVFEAVGYDPEEWTGFAFGLGIERIAMRKYGIADIRWLFENDARFLRQF
ncbi:MAG: phenylalanine--tRNA ligase subunit alpha [Planctomycetota bacterium]|jgi:phenylalanyl-tRNA synthetase alpha chain